jgi:hypothetical protein
MSARPAAGAEGLESLMAALDAEVAARAVMAAYMRACDDHDPDAVADLFHDGATWRSERTGAELHGREAIHAAYVRDTARLTFCVHCLTNEWIEADGDRVTARWSYFEPAVNRGVLAVWTAGRYEVELSARSGRWRFDRFSIAAALAATQASGWGDGAFVDLR